MPVTLGEAAILQKKVVIAQGVLDQNVGGGAVLLDVSQGLYFGLDDSGYEFWKALKSARNIEAAFLSLRKEYDVGDEELKTDLLALVNELVVNGLIAVVES